MPILKIFLLAMFFLAANTYITRFYYAKGNSYVPVLFSIINVFLINIAVIYLFIDSLGAMAIAWGTFISSVINFVMLAIYANRKFKLAFFVEENKEIWKIFLAVILVGIITYLSSEFLLFEYKWLTFIVGVTIFGISFVGIFLLLGIKEAKLILMKLNSSIKRLMK